MKEGLLDLAAALVLAAFAVGFVALLVWVSSEQDSQKRACNARSGTWSYNAVHKAYVCSREAP